MFGSRRLAGLPEVLPVAVAVLRPDDAAVLYANARFAQLVGVAAAELAGRPLGDLLSAPGLAATLGAAAEAGREAEVLGRRGDGTPLRASASARRGGYDGVPGALVTAWTEVATLALLAELPEKNPGPVCRLAPDGTVLMANEAARAFLGGADLRGRDWHRLCPGVTPQLWRAVLAGGRASHESERDGRAVSFTYVRSERGDVVFAYGADVTARREGERLLREQAAALAEQARFPEMNPGPVLRLAFDATVVLANAAARAVFGDAVAGRPWPQLCPAVLTGTFWQDVVANDAVYRLQAHIGGRDYVFAHRRDPRTRLVFVFGADVTAQKQAEEALRRAERMATLGTLAAGVAHELNNPAAATRRAAGQLRDAFAALEDAHLELDAGRPPDAAWELLRGFERRGRECAARPVDLGTVERADREAAVEDWLDERDVPDPWDLAPALVSQGLDPAALAPLAGVLDGDRLAPALAWVVSAFRVHSLAHEIGQGSARISEIVGALKSYSYLGQAPVQDVDLHEGLDNTLVIMRGKLKTGVTVRREYGADVPPVPAWGGELNQVWTNLLDNAADAMGGRGEITIRTYRDGDEAVVEIADTGPGIPEAIRSQVFDPFFTTKPPGKGTGLGLSTSYSIVTGRHSGTISVASRPGSTCFTVRLPTGPPPPAPDPVEDGSPP
jgi:signal transduction histidine kinase